MSITPFKLSPFAWQGSPRTAGTLRRDAGGCVKCQLGYVPPSSWSSVSGTCTIETAPIPSTTRKALTHQLTKQGQIVKRLCLTLDFGNRIRTETILGSVPGIIDQATVVGRNRVLPELSVGKLGVEVHPAEGPVISSQSKSNHFTEMCSGYR
jgi:hypothetical protein